MRLGRNLLFFPLLALASCSGTSDNAENKIVTGKIGKVQTSADAVVAADTKALGTPMAERVAVLGLLNKRNGQTRDIELKPGEAIRFGKVVVRLRACEKTAPWENYPDEGAFVQLIVRERPPGTTDPEIWRQVFSGWLFKENPAANVVQHRVYDVWVKACKMSFPGEEEPVEAKPSTGSPTPADKKPSSAPQSPTAAPTAPAATNAATADDTAA
jgi:hypothetical protein